MPIVPPLKPHAGALIAARAYQHNVRQMNWGLKFNDARLNLATPGTHGTLVLFDRVNPGNDDAVFPGQYPLHCSTQTLVVAGNNLYSITFLDSASHPTYSFNRLQYLRSQ
jgi:hypothetical protein